MIQVMFNLTGKYDVSGPELVKECDSFKEATDYIRSITKKFGKPISGYYSIESN